jgi:glycosyltransferase involved in cell wall biosynthesis
VREVKTEYHPTTWLLPESAARKKENTLSFKDDLRDHHILFCHRSLPARAGKLHGAVPILIEAGYQVTQVAEGPLDLAPDRIVWIQGNANWFPAVCRQLVNTPRPERPPVILWHCEPLPPPKISGLPWPRPYLREIVRLILRPERATDVYSNYYRLRHLARHEVPDLLIASTPSRWEFMAEHGMAAHWIPLGYDPANHGRDLGLPRDIDVLFLGTLDVPRRNRQLERLRRKGIRVSIVGSWSDPACWGENRTGLLNRTKVLLNISRHPGNLSDTRLILGMANKVLVIAEPMYKPDPFVPGQHYVSASVEEMPEAIRYYLAHADERQRIVDEGHRLVTQEATLAHSVARILELLRKHIR